MSSARIIAAGRRLLRWSWRGLIAVSLLACLGSTFLWIRSHWYTDNIGYETATFESRRRYGGYVDSQLGVLQVVAWSRQFEHSAPLADGGHSFQSVQITEYEIARSNRRALQRKANPPRLSFLGFRFEAFHMTGSGRVSSTGRPIEYPKQVVWSLLLPHWMLAVVCSIVPLVWAIIRLCRRHPPGTCRKCGYDLRATPDRCPECGTLVEAADPSRSLTHTSGV
jgi:hypothetical protein